MKKKLVMLLAAVCAASLLGGCGTDKKDNKKTSKENKETAYMNYEASEYVTLGEYKGLKVSLDSNYEVTEEDVKNSVEGLLSTYPAYEDSDKTNVEKGDIVDIDYEGLKDGEAFEGGTAKGAKLEIGSNSFIEGFEDGLIGKNVGEKVALDLTFPKDYQNKDLAGKAVVFNVTINKIVTEKDITYDTMTDEYVEANFSASGFKTVEDLKNGMKDQLTASKANSKETDTQNAVLKKLKEVCKIKSLPDGVLDQRIKEYKEQMAKAVKENYNIEMEEYLKNTNTTQKEFDKQVKEYMQENLEMEMILNTIADKEKIKVDEEGYKEYLANVVKNGGYENEEELMKEYGEDYVKNIYRNNKAMDMVRKNAKVSYGEAATEE